VATAPQPCRLRAALGHCRDHVLSPAPSLSSRSRAVAFSFSHSKTSEVTLLADTKGEQLMAKHTSFREAQCMQS